MIALMSHYGAGLLVALLIGIATGWWTWGARRPLTPAEEPIAWPAGAPGDDLMAIKGIDAEIAGLLRDLGVTRFAQIAAWLPEDIERIDSAMGPFKGRLIRDEWIAQARLLARGELALFEERYRHL